MHPRTRAAQHASSTTAVLRVAALPRRVLAAVVLAVLVVLATPVLVPGAATATAAPDLVVAVEEVDENVGPDVRGPNDADNAFAPSDLEANYLWGANWGLLVLIAVPFALMGLLYWLKVGRHQRVQ